MSADSILDKIMAVQQSEEAQHCQAGDLLEYLLGTLTQREKDVLLRRFALVGHEGQTLKQVGEFLSVTRERVRQIETQALRKLELLLGSAPVASPVQPFIHIVTHIFESNGGIMNQQACWEEFARVSGVEPGDTAERTAFYFLISYVLTDRFDVLKENRERTSAWKLHFITLDDWQSTVAAAKEICTLSGRPLSAEDFFAKLAGAFPQRLPVVLEAHMLCSKVVRKNLFNQYGLSQWHLIVPKRVKDKIYLILKREEKPLHFTKITELINEAHFDHKTAYPSTVHNELILDSQYVLVGRGIYALKEWGYERGVVSDVIAKILSSHTEGLTRERIIDEVFKQRIVRKSTIVLALTDRNRFTRSQSGRYTLNSSSSTASITSAVAEETVAPKE